MLFITIRFFFLPKTDSKISQVHRMEKYHSPVFVIIAWKNRSIESLTLKVQLLNKDFL